MAQEAGLIVAIGHWVLATACAQMALWHRQFPQARSVFMSVNLSSPELAHSDLIVVLEEVLARSELDPRLLKIEMTEELLVHHSEVVLSQLHAVRSLGIQLCVDDFGTGYSSLSYLDRLPVDFLKVDRSFVARLLSGHRECDDRRSAGRKLCHEIWFTRVFTPGVSVRGRLVAPPSVGDLCGGPRRARICLHVPPTNALGSGGFQCVWWRAERFSRIGFRALGRPGN